MRQKNKERLEKLAEELAWFHKLAKREEYIDYSVSGSCGCLANVRRELRSYLSYLQKESVT